MAKTKPAPKRKKPTKRQPAPGESSEQPSTRSAGGELAERQRLKYERSAILANQQLEKDQADWVSVSQIRESLADEDKRRFTELVSINLPAKLRSNLTDRQALFCYELFRDGKQEKAYIRAGFSAKASPQRAYSMMQQSGVRQAIDWLADACAAQDESSLEWLVRQLRAVYEACRAAVPALDRNGKPLGTFKIDAAGALRALELIGKARQVFTQTVRHEHSGSVTHLLQAIAGTGKPALEDRAAIDVTPSQLEPDTGEAVQQTDDEIV